MANRKEHQKFETSLTTLNECSKNKLETVFVIFMFDFQILSMDSYGRRLFNLEGLHCFPSEFGI